MIKLFIEAWNTPSYLVTAYQNLFIVTPIILFFIGVMLLIAWVINKYNLER